MNIVKGVADLLRRSAGVQTGEGGSWARSEKQSAPSPRIQFSETSDESILHTLWQQYENIIEKVEKRKSLQVFLSHFIQTYNNWEPENNEQLSVEQASPDVVILGCSSGHPSEVILILIQEIARLTSLLLEFKNNASDPSTCSTSVADGLSALNCLTITNRSMHNCMVFSYYGGVQKITALLKAAVVLLKTLTSTLCVDELSSSNIEKIQILQNILRYAVLVVYGFMELYSSGNSNVKNVDFMRFTSLRDIQHEVSSKNLKGLVSEVRTDWQKKAIVLVMEAGGVNWLVELLRVIRRLNLKKQRTDLSLHYLTLCAAKLALFNNPRAQNHFRSIGGLEVLLDEIGPPSCKFSDSMSANLSGDDSRNYVFGTFYFQVISMVVLRETVFGNMNNLQFLCENGRLHKFANSVCWAAFSIQEFNDALFVLPASESNGVNPHSIKNNLNTSLGKGSTLLDLLDCSNLVEWNRYSTALSIALCSFLLASEDIKFSNDEELVKSSMLVSLGYRELSIRWIMKVLLTIFPCIKACSSEGEFPNHIRVLANTLQHCILCTFRKVLVSAPVLLEVFREEGIWDMIFSELFFYFRPSLEFDPELEGQPEVNSGAFAISESCKDKSKSNDVDPLQVEAISFLEFAATLNTNTNNEPECSVLLATLEQSARNPEVATIILSSLRRILQLTTERSLDSFKSLDAIHRVLKVACIQAQEVRNFSVVLQNDNDVVERHGAGKIQKMNSSKVFMRFIKCMRSSMELFNEYLSIAEHVRSLVLHNASCINCLFDLFWEESLRKLVFNYILELLKLPPLPPDDRAAKLQLCSKYLETFTRAKESEQSFPELSVDLLINMREIILVDQTYYQTLFRDVECFLHIISLLNGTFADEIGEQLVLNVLQTLTLLLNGNIDSKAAFRALVGAGYQTLESLLLDFCKWQPSERLLNALLDMLVDGKFDMNANAVIKNDDVILLFFNVLKKSSSSLQHYGVDVFQKMLESITNRTSCFRAGLLNFLLDWYGIEENGDLTTKLALLIQVIGGYSISGKDIRKIFALLRSKGTGSKHNKSSLLLTSILYMLREKGPEAFFEFNGNHSGILINTPLQWPYSKGFSFSCWLRVEEFPEHGVMGLFSFLSDSGRGCLSMLDKEMLIFESISQKRHRISLSHTLLPRKWHFFCVTHAIGRAFSGGSPVRCYVDGDLVCSEKCRYAKIGEALTRCTIGAESTPSVEGSGQIDFEKAYSFCGQMGPVYMFSDALTPEQIKDIFSLGPSYMYSFRGDEILLASDSSLYDAVLDAKDGLSSKIIVGLNAQASSGSSLFNVSSLTDSSLDKNVFTAKILNGTQLCSRLLLQEIIYCVGGATVFLPLLTQFDVPELDNVQQEYILFNTSTRDKLAAETIYLISSVLDGNLSNQRQMHHLSGLSILGFLFQSVPPQQLNMETLSALKHLFDVLNNSGISELFLEEAMSRMYLNPHIWIYASYEVQRDLYMFLVQYFEKETTSLPKHCGFPHILHIIGQFYWDKADSSYVARSNPLLRLTKQVIVERPNQLEVRKIRLLLLSLAEMSLRQRISASDIIALIAFFEKSQDMVCIEDVLHMVIRAISQKQLLASFLEQVYLLGGPQLFVILLQRKAEPIRLLGLEFLGKLLVGLPPEKKGTKFFSLSVGRSKSISENIRKGAMTLQPVYTAISERLFAFPLSDHLYATLFDVLLGGASPKQVLRKCNPSENPRNKEHATGFTSHFLVPQIVVCIFKYLARCHDAAARTKILGDLLDLLESNLSNAEALMEYAWSYWLATSLNLVMFNNIENESKVQPDTSRINEIVLLRNLYCLVLSHYVYSVKGGWQQFEETVNFFLLNYKQGGMLYTNLLRDILEDLVGSLLEVSSYENIFVSQPCRDNSLYLLKVADELLISENGDIVLFPEIAFSSSTSTDFQHVENQKYISSVIFGILNPDSEDMLPRYGTQWCCKTISSQDSAVEDDCWILYDKLWLLISKISGKGPSKALPKSTSLRGPTFGQRARGLVESLNISAAEMAAIVVSGGVSTAFGTKTSKNANRATFLRGEKGPRIVFHLLILYLSKAGLERASGCVQQFISLLPYLLSCDDDQSRNRLHFLIWSLLAVRSQHGMLDDGARFHIISNLVLEIVNYGKSILATSILGRDDTFEVTNNTKEAGFILSLIQKDRVLTAAADEAKYIQATKIDRRKQLQELHAKLDECSLEEYNQWKVFEEDMASAMNVILSSDDSRKAFFQLACDVDQQIIADKWIHMFRTLVDERGPWSANPFPNNKLTHWKLDKTEDNWRRRPKLKRNYKFDKKFCDPPTNKSSHFPNEQHGEYLTSKGSNFPEQMKRFLLKGVRGITEERPLDLTGKSVDLIEERNHGLNSSSENQVLDYRNVGIGYTNNVHDRKNLQFVPAEVVTDEVHLSVSCVLISPKRKLAGHLSVMQNFLHFMGRYVVEGTGSSVLNKFSDESISDPTGSDQLIGTDSQKQNKEVMSFESNYGKGNVFDALDSENFLLEKPSKLKLHRRWNISKIKAVHWTRYLLQYTAIEIFFSDSVAPIFLNFVTPQDAKHVGSLIVSLRNASLFPKASSKDRTGIISLIDRNVALEMAETFREGWRRREISNFEYIMLLNTLAGRSYNDLTQYPVFPWVLADYSSEKLDFNKSSTFRDLSKPVGALDSKRFEVFEDRFRNFSDPDIPSFYYGSHYSSMGIVLFYLLRMEPFTALHRNLQGGKFDHADRLFQSIEGTYRNCLSNTSDVKELIPEFFYMPEFLVNSNFYHFGMKQDGEAIGDVLLPPWAKGSPEEFIYRNREALESEYVSSNLHHWIDLIFGYKQRGKPAVEAANVFYYLTYEGAVDLESLEDTLQRSAIEDQIANFGQTPIQIFRKKHPKRGPPIPIAHPLNFAPSSIMLTSIISNATNYPSAIIFVGLLEMTNIVLVNQDLILSVKLWLTTQLQFGGNYTFSGSQEPFFGIGSDVLSTRRIGTSLADGGEDGIQCLAAIKILNENYLILCGNWKSSFQVISMHDGKIVQSIHQHKDLVSCIAVTSDGSILATGSYDTTVMVWHVYRGRSTEKKGRNINSDFRKDHVIIENPFHILCGHDDIITCLFISLELDIVISGSKDGTCIFHTLREGRYVRSIRHPSGCSITKLVVSQHGCMVIYSDNDLSLNMYSINGKLIGSSESNGRLNCIELSGCGDFLVCAGDHGQILLRSMHSLDILRRFEGTGKVITSLLVTPEECILAGTKDGSLLLYSIDNPHLRKGSFPRNAKPKSSAMG